MSSTGKISKMPQCFVRQRLLKVEEKFSHNVLLVISVYSACLPLRKTHFRKFLAQFWNNTFGVIMDLGKR